MSYNGGGRSSQRVEEGSGVAVCTHKCHMHLYGVSTFCPVNRVPQLLTHALSSMIPT